MIKYDRNEFLKPQIYSTNDSYETRCIVNNEITDDIKQLQQENQTLNQKYINAVADYEEQKFNVEQLKKQLENCYCERTDCSGRIKESKQYDSLVQRVENQQKEFISYLENEIKNMNPKNLSIGEFNLENDDEKMLRYLTLKDNLSKYKEIIGNDINVGSKGGKDE